MDNADVVNPDLAESWQMGNDGQTYTFKLKRNVTWHDGRALTATDVKYSFDKMADPARASADVRTFTTGYKSSEALDDATVKVDLAYPKAGFVSSLSLGFMVIEPKHVTDAGRDSTKTEFLVGTGPFKFREATPGVSWTVERNPNYHHPGKPYVDGIQAFVVSDPEAQIAVVASKRVDLGSPLAALTTPEDVDKLRARAPGVVILPYASAFTNVLIVNLTTGQAGKPWGDPRVRQALFLALDLPALRQVFKGKMAGDASFSDPGTTLGPTAEELAQYVQATKPRATRVTEAKQLLTAAGHGSGFDIRLTYSTACPACARMNEAVDEEWRQIGVRTTLVPLSSADWVAARQRSDFDIYQVGWTKILGTLGETFGAFVSDAPGNAGYRNPTVDRLYQQLSTSTNLDEQKRLARQIEGTLWQDLPFMPLLREDLAATWWPWVHGYSHTRVDYFAHSLFDQVWLSERN